MRQAWLALTDEMHRQTQASHPSLHLWAGFQRGPEDLEGILYGLDYLAQGLQEPSVAVGVLALAAGTDWYNAVFGELGLGGYAGYRTACLDAHRELVTVLGVNGVSRWGMATRLFSEG